MRESSTEPIEYIHDGLEAIFDALYARRGELV